MRMLRYLLELPPLPGADPRYEVPLPRLLPAPKPTCTGRAAHKPTDPFPVS